jgi:hypothetical protein
VSCLQHNRFLSPEDFPNPSVMDSILVLPLDSTTLSPASAGLFFLPPLKLASPARTLKHS